MRQEVISGRWWSDGSAPGALPTGGVWAARGELLAALLCPEQCCIDVDPTRNAALGALLRHKPRAFTARFLLLMLRTQVTWRSELGCSTSKVDALLFPLRWDLLWDLLYLLFFMCQTEATLAKS